MLHLLVASALSFTVGSATQNVPIAQSAPLKLAAVEVVGTKRYSSEEVSKIAGLRTGQPITVEALKEAAERVGRSGLFTSINYRYTTAAGQMTVTFEVEEAASSIRVIFDNFVWFSDSEIAAAVRQDVPSFDGTAPHAEGISDLISKSLQKLLQTRSIPGRVDFIPQADLRERSSGGTDSLRYIFAVRDPAPKVCGVRIIGASAVPEADLVSAVQESVGTDYSRFHFTRVADGTLLDKYRNRGYWGAAFGPPSAAVDAPRCDGVMVTLPVTEGIQYQWNGAAWSGNSSIQPAELSALMDLKPGEVAELSRIDAGLRERASSIRQAGLHRSEPQLLSAPGRGNAQGRFRCGYQRGAAVPHRGGGVHRLLPR